VTGGPIFLTGAAFYPHHAMPNPHVSTAFVRFLGLVGMIVMLVLGAFAAEPNSQSTTAERPPSTNFISVVQGTVEIRRGERGAWLPAKLNDLLAAGDEVRTLERSRAEVVLISGAIIKLGAFSDMQVPPTVAVQMKRGIFQIFNRDRMKGGSYSLPGAVAAIRGTDFLVQVAEDGRSTLSVLDGEVTLSNRVGAVDLGVGDQGAIAPGQAPTQARLDLKDKTFMQWSFYYPAVLNVNELKFETLETEALAESLKAYREGALPKAFDAYPWGRSAISDAERLYQTGLLLSAGQVDEALSLLAHLEDKAEKRALLTLVSAVRLDESVRTNSPTTSSEWLAESYYRQSRGDLAGARVAARRATEMAPDLGFAWARLAELEFSFAERKAAANALDEAVRLSPQNAHAVALRGFVLAAGGHSKQAQVEFERAIGLDSAYANGWLGRGLCLIRQGLVEAGERDLFVAATLEPQRAVYRSYLGKAFQEAGDRIHARRELNVAKRLDENDPTAWLYSALLDQAENRNNEAVRELEYSKAHNEARGLVRSRLLLDEDRAVRGANLAAIYRDVGMQEVSVREAAEAVRQDYANFSAHLFLANSYNDLRDASFANLRYETATFSEYLMANLLSPVGGTPLSQQVSQQEYSRFFERDRLGFSSETAYLSDGQWQQTGAQFGVWGNFAYALEGAYRRIPGDAPNANLDQRAASLQLKQQIDVDDTVYFQAVYDHLKFGDVLESYDPSTASRTLRNHELQDPNLFVGWHHQWSPGSHTLLLFSNLRDDLTTIDPSARITGLAVDANGVVTNTMGNVFGAGTGDRFNVSYNSQFQAFGGELQQIWRTPQHTIVAGFRGQTADIDSQSDVAFAGGFIPSFYFDSGSIRRIGNTDLERLSGYGYWQWQIVNSFSILGGVSVEHIRFPSSGGSVLMSDAERTKTQVSPKAGFTWMPIESSTVRGAYSRSLGGLFFDNSVRLEPVQIAGFNQVFRSIAPESVAGLVPGTEFEAFDIGSEHRLRSATYFGWQAELLRSEGERTVDAFTGSLASFDPFIAGAQNQEIKYRERSVRLYANQLVGNEWSFGAGYRLSDSEFEIATPAVSPAAWPEGRSDRAALLHQIDLHALYNHRRGWFATSQALWTFQDNRRDDAVLPTEDFWQLNVFAGYRWPRRRAELTVGVLNLTDQDYRLNPVSMYSRLSRDRTFFTSLLLNF
jgi:Tfp pilus assembly protein PilF